MKRGYATALLLCAAGCGGAAGCSGTRSQSGRPEVEAGEQDGGRPAAGPCDSAGGRCRRADRPRDCRGFAGEDAIRFEEQSLAALGVPGEAREQVNDCVLLSDLDGDGAIDLALRGTEAMTVLWGEDGGGLGDAQRVPMPEALPAGFSGCLVADLDGDGLRDLLLAGDVDGPPVVLRQRAAREFAPADLLGDVGPVTFRGMGAADADGDGLPDLYLGRVENVPPPFDCAAGMLDCERACGDDDLVCTIDRRPDGLVTTPDVVLRGRGEGSYADVTEAWGIDSPWFPNALAIVDLNDDLAPDFIVGNDFGPNPMFLSSPDGVYREVGAEWGMAPYNHAMGMAVADLDNDGWWDLYVTDAGPDQLYFGAGDRWDRCEAEAGVADLTREHFGWGVVAEDFDNDGDVDLYVTSSIVAQAGTIREVAECPGPAPKQAQGVSQVGYLLENCGDRSFESIDVPLPADHVPMVWFSPSAGADLDGDGGVDVVEAYPVQRARVLRNATGGRGRWLAVDLHGADPNWEALGALITVEAGGRATMRQVQAAADGGQDALRAHFGLGEAASARVTVRWRSGRTTTRELDALDRTVAIEE